MQGERVVTFVGHAAFRRAIRFGDNTIRNLLRSPARLEQRSFADQQIDIGIGENGRVVNKIQLAS